MTYYHLIPSAEMKTSSPLVSTSVIPPTSSTLETQSEVHEPSDFESVYIKPTPRADFDSTGPSSPSSNALQPNLPPKSMAELLNKSNDFLLISDSQMQTPNLAYWYGLSKFVVITPTRSGNHIDTESRANLVLSSATVAINNTGCQIPILVQVNANYREMYVGMCEGSSLRTHFQIVHFNYTPPQYSYLTGLLDVFKSKLVSFE
jgi:hypothetical protein